MQIKRCKCCGQEKPLDAFHRHCKAKEEVEVIPAAALQDREAELEKEREGWRGKAENRLHEWRLRDDDVAGAEAAADEAIAAKEMWRDRANRAEAALRKIRSLYETACREEDPEDPESEWDEDDPKGHAATFSCFQRADLAAKAALDTSIEDRESERCERCGGKGRLENARASWKCSACNGTGTKPPAPELTDAPSAPDAPSVPDQLEPPAPSSDPEGEEHRVEIEFDGFYPSVRLIHPEGGCPLPDACCESCEADLRDPESKRCPACKEIIPGYCGLTDWVEAEGHELVRGKVTVPIRIEWVSEGEHPLLHLATPTQPAVPVPSGASGDWPEEITLVRNRDGGQPSLLKAKQRSWLPTEHDETRRYIPAPETTDQKGRE